MRFALVCNVIVFVCVSKVMCSFGAVFQFVGNRSFRWCCFSFGLGSNGVRNRSPSILVCSFWEWFSMLLCLLV